jgi:hypothetical protein
MKTTININKDSFQALALCAQSRGISQSRLAILLLKKELSGISVNGCFGSLVKYQKQARPGDWHKFHICYRPDEYEYFQDMRRLSKFSVSYLLQRAIKKYLLKKTNQDKGDNYPFKNYMIIKDIVNNIICWKHYWGYPPGIEEILNNKHPA